MCGIAGVSLSPTSKVNVRGLAHSLLAAIENRGSHASGYAFFHSDDMGVYKDHVPGSQLPLTGLPRRAETVILHTRFATQGAVENNDNNHPVISPDGNVALVHNGVISNDFQFRTHFGGEFGGLPAVDTAVIPALIERYGIKKAVPKLEGYAAIGWIDDRDQISGTLNIARLDYSPVAFTWLLDGSFVFASTEQLLAEALRRVGLNHGHIFNLPEETFMQVSRGIIMHSDDGYKMQEDWMARNRYGSATAGGHGATTGSYSTPIGATFGNRYDWEDDEAVWEDIETNGPDYGESFDQPMAMTAGSSPAEDEDLLGFYVTLDDGSIDYVESLQELESQLSWLAGLTLSNGAPFPEADKKIRWTNQVIDMGHISVRDSLVSWIQDMAHVDQFESPFVRNLEYIRDGAAQIQKLAAI